MEYLQGPTYKPWLLKQLANKELDKIGQIIKTLLFIKSLEYIFDVFNSHKICVFLRILVQ